MSNGINIAPILNDALLFTRMGLRQILGKVLEGNPAIHLSRQFTAIIRGLEIDAAAYERHLNALARGEVSETSLMMSHRKQITLFNCWFLDRTQGQNLDLDLEIYQDRIRKFDPTFSVNFPVIEKVRALQDIIQMEAAIQRELPLRSIRRFLEGERGDDIKADLAMMMTDLFKSTYFKPSVHEVTRGVNFLSIRVLGFPETQTEELCRFLNSGPDQPLSRAILTGPLSQEMMAIRIKAYEERTLIFRGERLQLGKLLLNRQGEIPEIEGRGYLNFQVLERNQVIRIGSHPLTIALELDQKTHATFVRTLIREAQIRENRPALEWVSLQQRAEPLQPIAIDGGVGLYELLQTCDFRGWKGQDLSRSQKASLEKLAEFLWELHRDHILPSAEGIKKFGFDGKGRLKQIGPVRWSRFSFEALMELFRQITAEDLEMFTILNRRFDWTLGGWNVGLHLKRFFESLLQSGKLPDDNGLSESEVYEERNFARVLCQQLSHDELYTREQVAKALGAYVLSRGIVRPSKWERVKADVKKILEKQKTASVELPKDLLPAYRHLTGDRTSQTPPASPTRRGGGLFVRINNNALIGSRSNLASSAVTTS